MTLIDQALTWKAVEERLAVETDAVVRRNWLRWALLAALVLAVIAFYALGSYTTAYLVGSLPHKPPSWLHMTPLLAIPFAIAVCLIAGIALGVPTLRLRADYLAIVTISAAEILRIIVNSTSVQSVTGGPQGIPGFANWFFDHNPIPKGRYGFGSITYTHRDLWVILVAWALVVLASLLIALLVKSPWGRVVRAIREDEDAVRSLGKNVFAYKMQSLVLGGVIGAYPLDIDGVDYYHFQRRYRNRLEANGTTTAL